MSYKTRKEISEIYPIAYSSLAHMASAGKGPVFRRVGKSAIYRTDEVEAWIEEQVIGPVKVKQSRKRRSNRQSLANQIAGKVNDNE